MDDRERRRITVGRICRYGRKGVGVVSILVSDGFVCFSFLVVGFWDASVRQIWDVSIHKHGSNSHKLFIYGLSYRTSC